MLSSYIELLGLFCLLMLPFLYETNHIFRYYFKFVIYYGLVSFNSMLLIPAFLFRPCDVRNLLWASTLCHRITTLIGLRWELRGKQHLEKEQACIIVANHQSSLDVLGMFNIWHVMNKCTAVAKRELFYAWPFGLAAWLAGLIFIDRVRGTKARATLNAVNSRIKKQKIKLWVFPEGTRRNTGELHSFKKGAFHMAIDEQIPILPVVFSSYCTFLNDKKKILNAGHVIITTLPPISTAGLTKDDIDMLMEHVHMEMTEAYKASSAEVLQRYKPHKAIAMPMTATTMTTTTAAAAMSQSTTKPLLSPQAPIESEQSVSATATAAEKSSAPPTPSGTPEPMFVFVSRRGTVTSMEAEAEMEMETETSSSSATSASTIEMMTADNKSEIATVSPTSREVAMPAGIELVNVRDGDTHLISDSDNDNGNSDSASGSASDIYRSSNLKGQQEALKLQNL